MAAHDALHGWNELRNAHLYAEFTRHFPMYGATSRDLVARTELDGSRLIVDLCGGTGITAQAILDVVPRRAQVISLDRAQAMQQVGRATVHDERLTWITAPAEDLNEHVQGPVDAVVCNSGIWKTCTPTTFAAVHRVLRPGGRFVFNVGGGFAGVTHPDEKQAQSGPSLTALIHQVAAREYGYVPSTTTPAAPKLPVPVLHQQLQDAGFIVRDTKVIAQHSTMEEKRAWLSIPLFSRPQSSILTHKQRLDILAKAYAQVDPHQTTVTSWLVVTAQSPRC